MNFHCPVRFSKFDDVKIGYPPGDFRRRVISVKIITSMIFLNHYSRQWILIPTFGNDHISYPWEKRNSSTQKYWLGKGYVGFEEGKHLQAFLFSGNEQLKIIRLSLLRSSRWCSFSKGGILLMEEILHHLIGSLPHYLQGFIHPRRCRISSINSLFSFRTGIQGYVNTRKFTASMVDWGILSRWMWVHNFWMSVAK